MSPPSGVNAELEETMSVGEAVMVLLEKLPADEAMAELARVVAATIAAAFVPDGDEQCLALHMAGVRDGLRESRRFLGRRAPGGWA